MISLGLPQLLVLGLVCGFFGWGMGWLAASDKPDRVVERRAHIDWSQMEMMLYRIEGEPRIWFDYDNLCEVLPHWHADSLIDELYQRELVDQAGEPRR